MTASVIKVPVALAAENAFAAGSLDPRARVLLRGGEHVSGPVGMSLYSDDVEASLRDLCVAMLTISDNVATDAVRTNRTTPREAATLLRLIWNDQAGPAAACARVRWMMARQLTKNRLASGSAPPARVAAKSGGLIQRVRNEIGVVQFPDGRGYSVAVFTRTGLDERNGADAAVNAAIGAAAAAAVTALRHDGSDGRS